MSEKRIFTKLNDYSKLSKDDSLTDIFNNIKKLRKDNIDDFEIFQLTRDKMLDLIIEYVIEKKTAE